MGCFAGIGKDFEGTFAADGSIRYFIHMATLSFEAKGMEVVFDFIMGCEIIGVVVPGIVVGVAIFGCWSLN